MPELKKITCTVYEVDYNDVDRFISEVFEIKYESVAYEEWGNYESHHFDVEPKGMDDYDRRKFERKEYHYILSGLLSEACRKELIQPGRYLINVFW